MRVLLANHTPTYGSGSGSYTQMLALGLLNAGWEVGIVTPLAKRYQISPKLKTFSVPLFHNSFPSFTGHPLSSITYANLNAPELEEIENIWLDTFNMLKATWMPNIIHTQHLSLVTKAAARAGFNPVVTCHGSEIKFAHNNPHISIKSLFSKLDQIQAIIFISSYVREITEKILGRVEKSHVLHNPCDTSIFHPVMTNSKTGIHLGFVGRLVEYKNCKDVIHLVAELKKEKPLVHATIIGDGDQRHKLEHLVNELKLESQVRFMGYIEQKNLPLVYPLFDTVVVPSIDEPFGLVALESVACGTPVIVAESGGLVELVRKPFIFGYNPNDFASLVQTTRYVLNLDISPNDAFQYVDQNYSVDNYIKGLQLIYKEA